MQKNRNMSSLAWMDVHNMYNFKRKEKLVTRNYNPTFYKFIYTPHMYAYTHAQIENHLEE